MSKPKYFCKICRKPLYHVKLAMDHGVCNWKCFDKLMEKLK